MADRLSRNELINKWDGVLSSKMFESAPLKDYQRKGIVAELLENTLQNPGETHSREYLGPQPLNETNGFGVPVNSMQPSTGPTGDASGGTLGGFSSGGLATGGVAGYDPVIINMVRRSAPVNMGFDFCGVQPMNGPTGLIFAFKARFDNQGGAEALYNEAPSGFSGNGDSQGQIGALNGDASAYGTDWLASANTPTHGAGMSTSQLEALGSETSNDLGWNEMSFTIEKTGVEAEGRALKTSWTLELAQDMRKIHGMEAENVVSEILTTEIVAETNRQIVRRLYRTAKLGSQVGVTTAGTFDLDTDANGRWSVEKFKGLIFQIEREANRVGQETRRGRGNFIICSADVASALQMTGMLDYTPALSGNSGLVVDDTGSTFAGILCGRYKVFIDPYAANMANTQFFLVGYKGPSPIDAGMFYCPYVPLQMVKAVDPKTFNPLIGFKTRYGLVDNPFIRLDSASPSSVSSDGTSRKNYYYRISRVTNLL